MSKVDLSNFTFQGLDHEAIPDLRVLSEADKEQLVMTGVDVEEKERSASFLHMDHSNVHCESNDPAVEIMDIKKALAKYDGLPEYFWKLIDKNQDEFTRAAAENLHGGYFIRTRKGAKIEKPVQSCLLIKADKAGQNVHNIVVVEEDSEVHIITGCLVSDQHTEGAHLGISEFYVKKGGKLTFTMIHNWGEKVTVRPRSYGLVEEGGVYLSNYVLMKPVHDLQMYPTIRLAGRGAVARFNSVVVAPEGSLLNMGNRVIMDAPETRAEIISRTITTGGTMIVPAMIEANAVPARGHLECKGLILGKGVIHAIPELKGTVAGVELSHEAAVGKIAQEEIEYLMARGMDEEEATSTIVRGFLNVEIMGLPKKLQDTIQKTIAESEKDMF
ncbi:MAG TPA: SufD family Fe-S cluster assembly protein [Desulfovibrio sp.]|jgi:Fe-S cluster assembly scaffold protein SufB|uniref:SufB/SufD family protein n=1 Tax=Desulfovibrio TaxID=872 RepID=UPI00041C20FB|nr:MULTISPECIES: SufD family Fe-S cluster assembly protein [Desulfovibrio]MDY0307572.1 SufD family Fe-S cluster assembly protein [Desulfovibrionaceae bacterium]HMM37708.1 SufD family Fe-S cluster assembly protein [Desulfovibrio sp.]